MMTQRERFLALLHNEPTDGFVNQYAALGLLLGDPIAKLNDHPKGQRTTTQWGITYDWPDFEPGPIPMTDDEHVVYAYGGEAYLNAALFAKLGVEVSEAGDLIMVEKAL